MPTGMSLPFFRSAASRGYGGVSQANYGLKPQTELMRRRSARFLLTSVCLVARGSFGA